MRLNDGSPSVLDRLARASDAVYDLVEDGRLWRVPDRDVLAGVDAAYALVTQAQAAALTILGELDARGLATEAGASSTQAWLAGRRRLGQTDAKRDVTLAQMLHRAGQKLAEADLNRPDDHAQVEGVVLRDALVTGQVSLAQAQAIATALDELPADITVAGRVQAERLLLAEADQHGPAALARLGHRISERLDPDGADKLIAAQLEREEREAQRLRSGTRFADGHGSVWYRFKVPVADDAFIHPILDTLAAPEPAGQAVDGYDIRSPQQRLADAFVETFRRVGLDGGLPTKGGDRPRVLITMDFEKLKRGTGYATMLDTGDQLSVEAVRRLACDAHVIPVVLGGHGQILDLGRARRTADGPLRVAVIARDQGCIHPGCTRPPRWCDVHHAIPWWAGGPTSLPNCVLLCGFHHKLYDKALWGISFAPDGVPEAIPPSWLDNERQPIRHERFLERAAT